MTKITFNELRSIKDSLPEGSMQKIADQLDLKAESVRNYFGGNNYEEGKSMGLHIEQGPEGGIVIIEDDTILNIARDMMVTV